jgi:RNA polymerase primary sigma factor
MDLGEMDEDDPVVRLVTLALDWADGGIIDRYALTTLLDEVDLPARSYRQALAALDSAGIHVVEDDDDAIDDDNTASVDGFGAFMRRTQHTILSFDEEQELGRRMERGRLADRLLAEHADMDEVYASDFRRSVRDGREAANELVSHNLRLVHSIAKLFSSYESPGLDREDLIQEGWGGLAHAVEKWDYRRELKFSTYGTWWIRQAMSRAVADRGFTVRLPVHARDTLNKILKAEAMILSAGDRPTIEAIAKASEIPVPTVRNLLSWRNRLTSLDLLIELGGRGADFDRTKEDDPEHFVEITLFNDAMHTAVQRLPPKEADIIRRRFGLDGAPVETLEQIGLTYNVTRERIRQIESKALVMLRGFTRGLVSQLP